MWEQVDHNTVITEPQHRAASTLLSVIILFPLIGATSRGSRLSGLLDALDCHLRPVAVKELEQMESMGLNEMG